MKKALQNVLESELKSNLKRKKFKFLILKIIFFCLNIKNTCKTHKITKIKSTSIGSSIPLLLNLENNEFVDDADATFNKGITAKINNKNLLFNYPIKMVLKLKRH